jgi:hypothetical protein
MCDMVISSRRLRPASSRQSRGGPGVEVANSCHLVLAARFSSNGRMIDVSCRPNRRIPSAICPEAALNTQRIDAASAAIGGADNLRPSAQASQADEGRPSWLGSTPLACHTPVAGDGLQPGHEGSVISTALVVSRANAKAGAGQSFVAGRRPAIVAHGGLSGHIALGDVPQNRGWITLRRRSIAPGSRQAETQDVTALDLTRLL